MESFRVKGLAASSVDRSLTNAVHPLLVAYPLHRNTPQVSTRLECVIIYFVVVYVIVNALVFHEGRNVGTNQPTKEHVCDWIHNVLIVMLVFCVIAKLYGKKFLRMIFHFLFYCAEYMTKVA